MRTDTMRADVMYINAMHTNEPLRLWKRDLSVCNVELAATRADRRVGLLGREGLDGVLVIRPCRSVHSFRMRFDLDIAGCKALADGTLRVRWIRRLSRNRLFLPSLRANVMVEAEAGSFATWKIAVNDVLVIK